MSSFIALKEKDGIEFEYKMPFNPIELGWAYDGACCCNVRFIKEDKMLVVATKKNRMELRNADKRIVKAYTIPNNQKEFEIINKWL